MKITMLSSSHPMLRPTQALSWQLNGTIKQNNQHQHLIFSSNAQQPSTIQKISTNPTQELATSSVINPVTSIDTYGNKQIHPEAYRVLARMRKVLLHNHEG
ncbi:MAG: hypothetical protein KTR14_04055, partial [Vampirovibrio sp.]|nr:hypothetical protein [Vampirovibrio sp.]